MKLYSLAHAGANLATSAGPIKVDADGGVEVSDEKIQKVLVAAGFKAKTVIGKSATSANSTAAAPAKKFGKSTEAVVE